MTYDNRAAPVHDSVLLANMGIVLVSNEVSLLAQPRGPAIDGVPAAGAVFPRVLSTQFEQVAGVGRSFWRLHRCTVAFLMYVDLVQSSWFVVVPPQIVTPLALRWDCRLTDKTVLEPSLRLAGSFQSLPNCSPEDAIDRIPPIDGSHFILDPCRSWFSLQAFMHMNGRAHPCAIDDILFDQHEPNLKYVLPKVRMTNSI